MQDNIDSICHRTICTNLSRSLKICVWEKLEKTMLSYGQETARKPVTCKYSKCTNTGNSGTALKRSFQLVVCKKAINLNIVHKLHRTKECEPCWKTECGYNLFSGPVRETKQACVSFLIITISTLFNHNRCLIDPSRRYIMCGIKAEEKSLRLTPEACEHLCLNKGNPLFFWNFFVCLSDFKCKYIKILVAITILSWALKKTRKEVY